MATNNVIKRRITYTREELLQLRPTSLAMPNFSEDIWSAGLVVSGRSSEVTKEDEANSWRSPREVHSGETVGNIKVLTCNKDVELRKAENAWRPSIKKDKEDQDTEEAMTQELFRKLRSILNKLTPEKFEQLMKRIKELSINTEAQLEGICKMVLEKAIFEIKFASTYAKMCCELKELTVPGSPLNFQSVLLDLCQEEFWKVSDDGVVLEKEWQDQQAVKREDRENMEELETKRIAHRKRAVGSMRFFGEMYKLRMVNDYVILEFVTEFLDIKTEEAMECLSCLITTAGSILDSEKVKPVMDRTFRKIQSIIQEKKFTSRVSFMLQDLMDLRQNNWVPRREEQGPKTIQEIHKEVEEERQLADKGGYSMQPIPKLEEWRNITPEAMTFAPIKPWDFSKTHPNHWVPRREEQGPRTIQEIHEEVEEESQLEVEGCITKQLISKLMESLNTDPETMTFAPIKRWDFSKIHPKKQVPRDEEEPKPISPAHKKTEPGNQPETSKERLIDSMGAPARAAMNVTTMGERDSIALRNETAQARTEDAWIQQPARPKLIVSSTPNPAEARVKSRGTERCSRQSSRDPPVLNLQLNNRFSILNEEESSPPASPVAAPLPPSVSREVATPAVRSREPTCTVSQPCTQAIPQVHSGETMRNIKVLPFNKDVELRKAENAWRPSIKKDKEDQDPEEAMTQELFRQLRSILNKLTPEKFEQLMKRIKELSINTEAQLEGICKMVLEKAIFEIKFASTYAKMCCELKELTVPGSHLNFHSVVLDLCQEEFWKVSDDGVVLEKEWQDQQAAKGEGRQNLQELETKRTANRKRAVGSMKFLGEMYRLGLVKDYVILEFVTEFLGTKTETAMECLCCLITTAGSILDSEKVKPVMDRTFRGIESIQKEGKLATRVCFMLLDLMDLRQNNWVPRREEQGPKTIQEIHKEVEEERRLADEGGYSMQPIPKLEWRNTAPEAMTFAPNKRWDFSKTHPKKQVPRDEEQPKPISPAHKKTELGNQPETSKVPSKETVRINKDLSSSKDVELRKTVNAWRPSFIKATEDRDPEEAVTQELFHQMRSLLNQLTPEKFQQLMKQIKELSINTEAQLRGIGKMVLEKAIFEMKFASTYAKMCCELKELTVPGRNKKWPLNFHSLMVDLCQAELWKVSDDSVVLEKEWQDQQAAKEEGRQNMEELETKRIAHRKRAVGSTRFFGELFKLEMVKDGLILEFVTDFLETKTEEAMECLSCLITTAGSILDSEKVKPVMDRTFRGIESIQKEGKLPSRVCCMLQDLMDLRQNNWVPRREEQGPKTIQEIHKEVEEERQLADEGGYSMQPIPKLEWRNTAPEAMTFAPIKPWDFSKTHPNHWVPRREEQGPRTIQEIHEEVEEESQLEVEGCISKQLISKMMESLNTDPETMRFAPIKPWDFSKTHPNPWVPRREEQGPRTIQEIHEEVEEASQLEVEEGISKQLISKMMESLNTDPEPKKFAPMKPWGFSKTHLDHSGETVRTMKVLPFVKDMPSAWRPSSKKVELDQDPEETVTKELFHQMRGILNQLTPEKFKQLMSQIKELSINTEAQLEGICKMVFEKAICEMEFTSIYAKMCYELRELTVPGRDQKFPLNFLSFMVHLCSKEFWKVTHDGVVLEKEWRDQLARKGHNRQNMEELETKVLAHRKRAVGSMRFLGGLFALRMVKDVFIHGYITAMFDAQTEEALECACSLIAAAASLLDCEELKPQMDRYFHKIETALKKRQLTSKVRLMLQDLLNLRLAPEIRESVFSEQNKPCEEHLSLAVQIEQEPAVEAAPAEESRSERDVGSEPESAAVLESELRVESESEPLVKIESELLMETETDLAAESKLEDGIDSEQAKEIESEPVLLAPEIRESVFSEQNKPCEEHLSLAVQIETEPAVEAAPAEESRSERDVGSEPESAAVLESELRVESESEPLVKIESELLMETETDLAAESKMEDGIDSEQAKEIESEPVLLAPEIRESVFSEQNKPCEEHLSLAVQIQTEPAVEAAPAEESQSERDVGSEPESAAVLESELRVESESEPLVKIESELLMETETDLAAESKLEDGIDSEQAKEIESEPVLLMPNDEMQRVIHDVTFCVDSKHQTAPHRDELNQAIDLTREVVQECFTQRCTATLQEGPEEEEALECLCHVLSTIGRKVDTDTAKSLVDKCMRLLEDNLKEGKTSDRIRVMIKHIMDLRQNNWAPGKSNQVPKATSQIHKDAELENQQERGKIELGHEMDNTHHEHTLEQQQTGEEHDSHNREVEEYRGEHRGYSRQVSRSNEGQPAHEIHRRRNYGETKSNGQDLRRNHREHQGRAQEQGRNLGQHQGHPQDQRWYLGEHLGHPQDQRWYYGEHRGHPQDQRWYHGEHQGHPHYQRWCEMEQQGRASHQRQYHGEQQGCAPHQRQYHGEQQGRAPHQRQYYEEQQGRAPNQRQYHGEQQGRAPHQRQYYEEQQGRAPHQRQYYEEQQGRAPNQRQYHGEQQGCAPNQRQYHGEQQGRAPHQRQYHGEQQGRAPHQRQYHEEQQGRAPHHRQYHGEQQGCAPHQRQYHGEQQGCAPHQRQYHGEQQGCAPHQRQYHGEQQGRAPHQRQYHGEQQGCAPHQRQYHGEQQGRAPHQRQYHGEQQGCAPHQRQYHGEQQGCAPHQRQYHGEQQGRAQERRWHHNSFSRV